MIKVVKKVNNIKTFNYAKTMHYLILILMDYNKSRL